MNFQYEIAQNSVTMSVNFFTELHKCEHKNESDQALIKPIVFFLKKNNSESVLTSSDSRNTFEGAPCPSGVMVLKLLGNDTVDKAQKMESTKNIFPSFP